MTSREAGTPDPVWASPTISTLAALTSTVAASTPSEAWVNWPRSGRPRYSHPVDYTPSNGENTKPPCTTPFTSTLWALISTVAASTPSEAFVNCPVSSRFT